MTIITGLFPSLNEAEEPVTKKRKKADEFHQVKNDFVLSTWISDLTKDSHSIDWSQFQSWLHSEHFKELSKHEISLTDCKQITKALINCTQNGTDEIMLDIVVQLVENRIFQHYFKYDLEKYFTLIMKVMLSLQNPELLLKLLTCEQLFSKTFLLEDQFHKHFFEKMVLTLSATAVKFELNQKIFEGCSRIVQRCLFVKNSKLYEKYFTNLLEKDSIECEEQLPILLFSFLKEIYKSNETDKIYTYKIIFHAFVNANRNDFSLIYKYLYICIAILGFDLELNNLTPIETNLTTSLNILKLTLSVLTDSKSNLTTKINDVTFSDFLQKLAISIINYTNRSNETTLIILRYLIMINPLLVESIFNHFSTYVMLSKNSKHQEEYEKIVLLILEVFSKLHRVQNFVSKLIPAFQAAVKDELPSLTGYTFNGVVDTKTKKSIELRVEHILPVNVVNYFMDCISSLASWQVINLFKTLQYHLNALVTSELQNYDKWDVLYIQVVCALLNSFLSSVRIAEHTVSLASLEKFQKCMEEQKDVLKKFGVALLNIEYNHVLMRAFLNLCYTCGELNILLKYYVSNNDQNSDKDITDLDSSACNLTYLHDYLTKDQWCMIMERITNFGGELCNNIMLKLLIQRMRAMVIFENEPDVLAIVKDFPIQLPDYYQSIINDPFCLNAILPVLEDKKLQKISMCLVDNVTENEQYDTITGLSECPVLVNKVIYTCLKAIVREITTEILPCEILTSHLDFDERSKFTEAVSRFLNSKVPAPFSETDLSKIIAHVKLLKHLPLVYCTEKTQEDLLCAMMAFIVDFKNYGLSTQEFEDVFIGITQHCSLNFNELFKTNDLMKFLTVYVEKFEELFSVILDSVWKHSKSKLKKVSAYVTKNFNKPTSIACCVMLLKFLQKHKKTKVTDNEKVALIETRQQVHEAFLTITSDVKVENIEVYALILKHNLVSSNEENLVKMQANLNDYMKCAMEDKSETTGPITLFLTIIQHKPRFEKIISETFILDVWNTMPPLRILSRDRNLYDKLVVAMFENNTNEQFSTMLSDLLGKTLGAIGDGVIFEKFLYVWEAMLDCSLNPIKMKTWQAVTEKFVYEVFTIGAYSKRLLKFQTKMAQIHQLILTPTILDLVFLTVGQVLTDDSTFKSCAVVLEALLKYRKAMITDRLPSFLQQYNSLLKCVCRKGNSDLNLDVEGIQHAADCAHELEKLTKSLCGLGKHMASIAGYVIVGILEQYEKITLYPTVKLHLNNCLYSLISLCDHHTISSLMRELSTASTEIFKSLLEIYKKYYQYTGKV